MTSRDKKVFILSGFGKNSGFGQRPALHDIDVNYNFTGHNSEPILQSVKRFRTIYGDAGWEVVYKIRESYAEARKRHLPTFTPAPWKIALTAFCQLAAGRIKVNISAISPAQNIRLNCCAQRAWVSARTIKSMPITVSRTSRPRLKVL